jgi:hypothetical protein
MRANERSQLLSLLEVRLDRNASRHPKIRWSELRARLERSPATLKSLAAMEATGGEPNVIDRDPGTGEITLCDRRYGQVFVHHNGAGSYDAARGFRGMLRV